jgi:succinylglutamate desuccinylase
VFGVKVRSSVSIRKFLANPHALHAIRRFNLTHMNRGRNAYQASHCYSLADIMVEA